MTDAANINNLDLIPESVPEVDYDSPESGSGFPPQIYPAERQDFIFKLGVKGDGNDGDRQSFEVAQIQGGNYLQVNFAATTTIQNGDGSKDVTLNFQRATTFQNEKMKKFGMNHGIGNLLRALGLKIEGGLTKAKIMEALTDASASGKHFPAAVVWRRYCKSCEQTISTSPRTKKGDVAWPRGADGKPEPLAACPKCGSKAFGNAELGDFKLPGDGATSVSSTSSVSGVSI